MFPINLVLIVLAPLQMNHIVKEVGPKLWNTFYFRLIIHLSLFIIDPNQGSHIFCFCTVS